MHELRTSASVRLAETATRLAKSPANPERAVGTAFAFARRMAEGLIPQERISRAILIIRGQRVLLDSDLAELYGVETRVLNQSVRRNAERFPADFMFRLSPEEVGRLRSQIVISNARGGRRWQPYAFTEQGVAMLSSVLHSPRAIAVNVEIMRAFVELRRVFESHAGLARKLEDLERRYDGQFKSVFEAIRQLMAPTSRSKRKIGFK